MDFYVKKIEFWSQKKLIALLLCLWMSFALCSSSLADVVRKPALARKSESVKSTSFSDANVTTASFNEADNRKHAVLVKRLIKRLLGGNKEKVLEAGFALKKTVDKRDMSELVQALTEGGSPEAEETLAEILGQLSDDRAVKALKFEIDHGTRPVRLAAIRSLGYIKHSHVVALLSQILSRYPDLEARQAAASALGRIGTSRARYALQTIFNTTEYPTIRKAIRWALLIAARGVNWDRTDRKIPKGIDVVRYYQGTAYSFYVPSYRSSLSPKHKLLICIHDDDLMAQNLFRLCKSAAKARSMAVLVPFFDDIRFPQYENLNYRGKRADKLLLGMIQHLTLDADLETREMFFFGHGAGGDFVNRFVMLYPERVARAAFTPDTYTMLHGDVFYPRGIKRNIYAPDIAIDVSKYIKTDAAIIIRSNVLKVRKSQQFFRDVKSYAALYGITQRISVRVLRQDTSLMSAWAVGQAYLFKRN